MESVSVNDIQELVNHLPEDKLPHAYRLLRELVEQSGKTSPQAEFMRLPISERRRLLAQQADALMSHYEATAAERQEWQSGDFSDEH